MIDIYKNRYAFTAVLGVFVLATSYDTLNKYYGLTGLVVYSVLGSCVLHLLCEYGLPFYLRHVNQRKADLAAIAVLLFLLVVVGVGYPIANSGAFGGGTDIDEAMIVGAGELFAGRYPYYQRTYLGGSLSPMPGTMLLAVPFVLLKLVQFQNLFWLAALFATARYQLKDSRYPLFLILIFVVVSPTFYQVLITGSDHISNTVYIIVALWFLVRNVSDENSSLFSKVWPAVLLGIGLSSRSNFIVMLPLLFLVLAQNSTVRRAGTYTGLAFIVFAIVTVPFWLYDPANFTPLTVQGQKVVAYTGVVPYAHLLVPGIAVLLSIGLGLRKMGADCGRFFLNCGIVQLFLLAAASSIHALYYGEALLFIGTSGYGMFSMLFGSLGLWIMLRQRNEVMELDK